MKLTPRAPRCAPFLLAALLAAGCGRAPAPRSEPVRPVHAMQISDAANERTRSFAGTVRPTVETEISFRVPGKIIELPAKAGADVSKGDLVARLDPSDYELQVKQAEAQFNQAQAVFKQANADHNRARELYESRSVSKSELDQARASFESARAQQEAAGKALEMARLQKDYCELRAPLDGRVASRPVEVFQTVQAGQPIATLAAEDRMDMVIGLPELLINRIRMGDKGTLKFDAIPDTAFNAVISEIAAETGGKGTYPVRLTILGETGELRAGMTGEASISFTAVGDAALYVPASSVVSRADGTHFVWVISQDDNTVIQRDVSIGALTSFGLEIKDGIESGEWIATRGVHKLAAGTSVRILDQNLNP